jgi:hypothetical protein
MQPLSVQLSTLVLFGYRNNLYLCVLFSQICPQLGLCPPAETAVALDPTHTVNDKPSCPLCLLATQSIIDKLKDKKTEVSVHSFFLNMQTTLSSSAVI